MSEAIVIGRRYRGPLHSANGGYAAGLLAAHVDAETVEVTLRLPPPLERPLVVRREDGRTLLFDGAALVAEARAGMLDLELPRVVRADAEAATARHVRWGNPEFSQCFSCGIRAEGDGLAIHPGPVPSREPLHAAPWVAHEVGHGVVWAAIDCSGAFAVRGPGRGEAVLGRMTGRVDRLPGEGEPCVVVGWPLEEAGRKLHAATALLDEAGERLAVARQIWIAPTAA